MMARKMLLMLLLGVTSAIAGTRVSVGVHIGDGYGYYPPPPPAYVYVPPCPGPGYVYISGYWYGGGPHRHWRPGYWAPPGHRKWHKVKKFEYRKHHFRDRHHRRGSRW